MHAFLKMWMKRLRAAGARPMAKRIARRECGDCTMCCGVLKDIPEISPPGSPCQHLCEGGCSIYEKRPKASCVDYHCGWRLGWGEDRDRPDKVGAIVEPNPKQEYHADVRFAGPFDAEAAWRQCGDAQKIGCVWFGLIDFPATKPGMSYAKTRDAMQLSEWLKASARSGRSDVNRGARGRNVLADPNSAISGLPGDV